MKNTIPIIFLIMLLLGCQDDRSSVELFNDVKKALDNHQYRTAYKDAKKLVSQLPEYSDSHLYLGIANIKVKEYARAMYSFRKAIELDSTNYKAFVNRAQLKIILGDYFGAIDDCNTAYNINDKFIDIYYTRGHAYEFLNETFNAITEYKNALRLEMDNSGETYYKIGMLYLKIKDIKEGCENLRKAGDRGYIKAFEEIKKNCNSVKKESLTIGSMEE